MLKGENEKQQIVEIQQYLKLVFPTIYGLGSKDNLIASSIFNKAIDYMKKDKLFFTNSKQRNNLIAKLTKASKDADQNSLKVIFKCQYACAIVIDKQYSYSPLNVVIITPQEWSSGANNWNAKQLDFWQPQSFIKHHLPSVAQHAKSINDFCINFQRFFDMALQSIQSEAIQKKQNYQYSVKNIEQGCKRAFGSSRYQNYYIQKSKQKQQNQQNKKQHYITSSKSISLNSSQANTCWYVPMALINYLIGKPKFAQKTIIGFKAYLLEYVTNYKGQNNIYSQKDVYNYKKCLDELIFKYRQNLSIDRNQMKNVKDFQNLISTINNNLNKITKNGLTSKIDDVSEIPGSLNYEKPQKATLIYPKQQKHKKPQIQLVNIKQYPLKVSQRMPFEHLLELAENLQQKQLNQQDMWILLTERTLFDLTKKICNNDEIIDFCIHSRQIQCQIGASNLCLLVEKYQKIVKSNLQHFGMKMKGQALSHIQLVKVIGAVVAFEYVKMYRQKKKSNLSAYRIPINIQSFHKQFISHSSQARKAMNNLLEYYSYRKQKKFIFQLNGTSKSFADFGRLVAEETRSAHVWISKMKKIQELKKQIIHKQIIIQQKQQKISKGISYLNTSSFYNIDYRISNAINTLNNTIVNSYQNFILSQYDENDPWLFAFLQNIPSDVMGMIKILMQAQLSIQQIHAGKDNLFENNFQNQQFSISTYLLRPQNEKMSFNSSSVQPSDIPTIKNFSDPIILYKGQSKRDTEVQRSEFFFSNNQSIDNKFKYLLQSTIDSKDKSREHSLYAKQSDKPQQIKIQDFLGMGNVRSGQNTQLMVLCHNILQRKIISNSYDEGFRLAQQIILQTAGQLSTYNKNVQIQFKKIQKLIQQIINIWAFTDVKFTPILAPFLAFIGNQLIDDKIYNTQKMIKQFKRVIYKICKKCIEQYDKGNQQIKKNQQLKIQWDQRFILTAAICCFRQILLEQQEQDQIILFCQLIFQLRSSKILSDRQQRPQGKRKFQVELLFSVQKAIYYNIEVISNLLNTKKQYIGKIVKKMDPGYNQKTLWIRQNMFSFLGKSPNDQYIYQLDLFSGRIYKNGKEISALDDKIKQNPYFIEMFGKDRQFQVFASHNQHFVRTKDNVNYQFQISEQKGLIFFQFSQDGNEIRHIYNKPDEDPSNEDVWVLITREQLSKSNCFIPKLFFDEYLAWYSQKRQCIIFRQKTFQKIYKVGIVIHLKEYENKPIIKKAFYITYHGNYKGQDLDDLCDIQTKKYEQIILRNKHKQLVDIRIFNLLNRFQRPQYIFELKNKKQQIQYLIHRSEIRFKLQQNTRLTSETYIGYSLDYSFYENQNCIFNKFPCLVLKKHSNDITLLNNHKRLVIISDGQVQIGGIIKKPRQAYRQIQIYKYDIHDFYRDLRGHTRQSLFHLSAVMLSINDNMKIASIQMTPLQYSIHLLNSCLSNRPLMNKQMLKINNIIQRLDPPESIVLLCQALWICSKYLEKILPFSILSKNSDERSTFCYMEEALIKCRTLYMKKIEKNCISYRQTINPKLLKICGILRNQSSQHYENDQWRSIQIFSGEDLIQDIQKITKKIQQFQISWNKMNIFKDQNQNKVIKSNVKLPDQIRKLAEANNCNIMAKQMVQQLGESYQTFIQQQAKDKNISKTIKQNKLQQFINLTQDLIKSGTNLINQIQTIFNQVKQINENHPDIITGIRPTFSYICFTQLICNKNLINYYFPHLTEQAEESFKKLIMIWIQFKTRISSLQRIKYLLNSSHFDIVAFMRQITSPRKQIRQKPFWLCFEAQNKVQLWSSQLDTYNNLMQQQKPGLFCQLNMGQGKTQVIIPLIILNIIYSKKSTLPRINLLTALMDQARGNFFRFLSVTGFQIPGFEIPFSREVKLHKQNINKVQMLIASFSSKAYILMSRESRLSQILRYYQAQKIARQQQQRPPLIPCKIFDIFDQIDALMTTIKSYIFSIGETQDLPQDKMRLNILMLIIQVFLNKLLKKAIKDKIVAIQQTQEDTLSFVERGQFPPGLRLNLNDLTQEQILQFRKQIARQMLFNSKSNHFSFIKFIKPEQLQYLINYIVNPLISSQKIPNKIPQKGKNAIFIMRGALAFGIFQHSLSMRCGVDYGIPNYYHKKRIAVPYQAADIPSKTSQYQQPDVSALLSYLAYYNKGLNFKQFKQALKYVLGLSNTSKQLQYKNWFDSLPLQIQQNLTIKNAKQINFQSNTVVLQLFQIFKNNRKVISFWLNAKVFPINLRQYKQSICASAWDLSDVQYSIGFSGTKDNHWLYSDKLRWKPCQTPSIKGTDGKMLYLIQKYTKQICLIQQNQKPQWQRFIDLALCKKVGCIIDAGALCVGKSLKNQIVPWIAQHQNFDKLKYIGISFCDQNGKWMVFNIQSKHYIPRGKSISDHQTFAIFDQARTRGADLKLNNDVTAAISLGPLMTKDKFMQAAGRLRKLGRDQKLIIMATYQIFSSFPDLSKDINRITQQIRNIELKELTNMILAWCCKNSISFNQKQLIQFSNLGWNYVKSKINKKVNIQKIKISPKDLYQIHLKKITVAQISIQNNKYLDQKYVKFSSGQQISKILQKYGKNVFKQAGGLDDVCQRQVETERQQQKQQQNVLYHLSPISQKDQAKSLKQIPEIDIKFNSKFEMTENFIFTTKSYQNPQNTKQLSQVYFILYDNNKIKAITLRQASMHIKRHIITKQPSTENIKFLDNLTIQDKFIKENKLECALVSAKLLSGIQNYTEQQQSYLIEIFTSSCQDKNNQQNYADLVSKILKKKRIYLKKFVGSTLEKIIVKLENQEAFKGEKILQSKYNQHLKQMQIQKDPTISLDLQESMISIHTELTEENNDNSILQIINFNKK